MRKHRLIRFVAVLLYIVAALFFLGGITAGILFTRNGFGAGWGPGSTAWVLIPILVAAVLGAIVFVVLASVLFFLARIDSNLSAARARRLRGPSPASNVLVVEAPPATTAEPRLPGRDEAARIAAEMAALRAAEGRQAAENAATGTAASAPAAPPPAASTPPAGSTPAAGSVPPAGSTPPGGNGSA